MLCLAGFSSFFSVSFLRARSIGYACPMNYRFVSLMFVCRSVRRDKIVGFVKQVCSIENKKYKVTILVLYYLYISSTVYLFSFLFDAIIFPFHMYYIFFSLINKHTLALVRFNKKKRLLNWLVNKLLGINKIKDSRDPPSLLIAYISNLINKETL